jgi:zinc and cadmium transporter
MPLVPIIIFTLLGSVGAVGFSALILLFKQSLTSLVISTTIPYSIGILLGAAFLEMIPRAQQTLPYYEVFFALLFGLFLFFILEKYAVWQHCHEDSCGVHTNVGSLIPIGHSLHNFIDGIAIASAFLSSSSLGIITSLAVIAHEIPQEVENYGILLRRGYSRTRALLNNIFFSLTALLGAIAVYFLLPMKQLSVPYFLSISASSFIYIALACLVPGRRITGRLQSLMWELPLMILGIGTVVML